MENSMKSPPNIKKQNYDVGTLLLCIHLKELKSRIKRGSCTSMFFSAFIVALLMVHIRSWNIILMSHILIPFIRSLHLENKSKLNLLIGPMVVMQVMKHHCVLLEPYRGPRCRYRINLNLLGTPLILMGHENRGRITVWLGPCQGYLPFFLSFAKEINKIA